MTDEQTSDWEYKIICCLGISTSNSDINVVGLHKTVKELYEQGRADEREAQVCCGDYEKCMKACTPRGRWLAENELAQPEQEPVSIGIDVTPEGTHVVACYNKPNSVREMFYSEFHPMNKTDKPKSMSWEEWESIVYEKMKRQYQWQGLTDEEINDFDKKLRDNGDYCSLHFAWGISAKLKEKNGL